MPENIVLNFFIICFVKTVPDLLGGAQRDKLAFIKH